MKQAIYSRPHKATLITHICISSLTERLHLLALYSIYVKNSSLVGCYVMSTGKQLLIVPVNLILKSAGVGWSGVGGEDKSC